ncbi:MAG: hypothetical protein GY711_01085 [bacterium]|nr:hypothetical protein [bacterium]
MCGTSLVVLACRSRTATINDAVEPGAAPSATSHPAEDLDVQYALGEYPFDDRMILEARNFPIPVPGVGGNVNIDLSTGKLVFRWAVTFSDGHFKASFQEESTSFIPSEFSVLDDAHVVVAGKTTSGHIVVERWKLRYPPIPSVIFSAQQTAVYPDYRVTVVQKTVVYDHLDPSADFIRAMWKLEETVDRLLVAMNTAGGVHMLDVATGTMTEILSPAQVPTVQSVRWSNRWSAEHADFGSVYFLDYTIANNFAQAPFVLMDTDSNGTIDTWHQMTDFVEYEAYGFKDHTKFLTIH